MTHVPEGVRAQHAVDREVAPAPAEGKAAAQAPGRTPERPPASDEFFAEAVQRPDVRESRRRRQGKAPLRGRGRPEATPTRRLEDHQHRSRDPRLPARQAVGRALYRAYRAMPG